MGTSSIPIMPMDDILQVAYRSVVLDRWSDKLIGSQRGRIFVPYNYRVESIMRSEDIDAIATCLTELKLFGWKMGIITAYRLLERVVRRSQVCEGINDFDDVMVLMKQLAFQGEREESSSGQEALLSTVEQAGAETYACYKNWLFTPIYTTADGKTLPRLANDATILRRVDNNDGPMLLPGLTKRVQATYSKLRIVVPKSEKRVPINVKLKWSGVNVAFGISEACIAVVRIKNIPISERHRDVCNYYINHVLQAAILCAVSAPIKSDTVRDIILQGLREEGHDL